MKNKVVGTIACITALFALAIGCAHTSPSRTIPVADESVYVMPLVDESSMEQFDGWPEDTVQADIISAPLDEFTRNLGIEVRRCEKFGEYRSAPDSSAATVLITPVIGKHSWENDTLRIPARIIVQFKANGDIFSHEVSHEVTYYWDSEPKSTYHLLGSLISEYVRTYPYDSLSSVLYDKNHKPNLTQ